MAPSPPTTILTLLLLLSTLASAAHNITAILSAFPDYSVYNDFLARTKVADEINSRETLTCLVLPNPTMSALAADKPLSAVKAALRLLTLLDYYDSAKLHAISDGSVLTTTLLQTTGNAEGNLGFVNITDLRGGKVGFGATSKGAKLDSVYTKSVKQIPFSISVLEISKPIVFPGLLDAPDKSANITGLLEKAGCKTFASLIVSSGVLKIYQDAMDKGLTVFAPNDEAFKAEGVPDLSTLSQAELVTLLQYHAIPQYTPKASLQSAKSKFPTLATNAAGDYDISVSSTGDDVSLDTGLDISRIASTVVDDTPLCILTVDSVLLPVDLFGKAPSPAPGPAPASAPSPLSDAPSPAVAPAPEALASSAAPESDVPAGSPEKSSDVKAADSADAVALARPLTALLAVATVAVFRFV